MNQLTDIAAKIEALPEDAILCVVPHEIRFAQADDLRGFDVDVPEIPHYPDVDVNDLKAIAAEVKRLTDENARLREGLDNVRQSLEMHAGNLVDGRPKYGYEVAKEEAGKWF